MAKAAVRWTEEEWDLLAREMHLRHPELNLFATGDVSGTPTNVVIDAMKRALPKKRHRTIDGTFRVKDGLVAAYARLREQHGDVPVQAAPQDTDDAPASTEEPSDKPRVVWTPLEWYAIASEIHRRNPFAKFPDSTTLAGLRLVDIKEAQRVLPRERHRHGLATVTQAKPPLLEAFKLVKADIEAEALRKQEAARLAEQEQQQAEAAPAPAETVVVVTQQQGTIESLVSQAATQLADTFATAFVQTFIDRFKMAFRNDLPQLLGAAMTPPPAQLPSPEPQQSAPAPLSVAPSAPAPVKPPHILVVGPLPQQAHELEKCYPQVKFSFFSSAHGAQQVKDAARNCDRAIGMTKFLSHSVDGALAKHADGRYTRVAGGVSDIKRQLDVWMHAGVIPRPQALAA